MLMDETDKILDDLLSRWHNWMREKPVNGLDRMDDPAFKKAQRAEGWDSGDDEVDELLNAQKMAAIDFHVSGDSRGQGGLDNPYRAAIYVLARNCYTGRKVWISPRLPKDPAELAVLLREARNMLTRRLMTAGIM